MNVVYFIKETTSSCLWCCYTTEITKMILNDAKLMNKTDSYCACRLDNKNAPILIENKSFYLVTHESESFIDLSITFAVYCENENDANAFLKITLDNVQKDVHNIHSKLRQELMRSKFKIYKCKDIGNGMLDFKVVICKNGKDYAFDM